MAKTATLTRRDLVSAGPVNIRVVGVTDSGRVTLEAEQMVKTSSSIKLGEEISIGNLVAKLLGIDRGRVKIRFETTDHVRIQRLPN